MKHTDYIRALKLALDGDADAWQPALTEALRRQDRPRQFELLRVEAARSGHPEWSIKRGFEPGTWHGVELCWSKRHAVLFAADCAERVLHLFEEDYPDDPRPRKAIEAAREWVEDPTRAGAADAAYDAYAAADDDDAAYAAHSAAAAADAGADAYAAYYAAAAADAAYDSEREWQRQRLAEYLLGEIEPCWE